MPLVFSVETRLPSAQSRTVQQLGPPSVDSAGPFDRLRHAPHLLAAQHAMQPRRAAGPKRKGKAGDQSRPVLA
jgi:hypothetical protein